MNLDTLADRLHDTAQQKGFWEPISRMQEQDFFVFYSKQIAMIHSEATEILEALRKDKGDEAVVEEIADLIIRALDLYKGIKLYSGELPSLDSVLMKKSLTNQDRPRLHGVRG
jgi:NTP pyrophosphatase (non-canonical NTP hydrolase)